MSSKYILGNKFSLRKWAMKLSLFLKNFNGDVEVNQFQVHTKAIGSVL